LLSSRLSFPSAPNSPDSVFLIHVPGKQAAVDVYVSVMYDAPLPLEIRQLSSGVTTKLK